MTNKKADSLQRVMDVAAEMATTRSAERISIAEIAAMARCSTATIYECFESKDDLLLEAFEHGQTVWRAPSAAPVAGEDALATLFRYVRERIGYMGSDRLRGLICILITHRQHPVRHRYESFCDQDQLSTIICLVSDAMAAGHFRESDARTTAYVLQASTSYEPLMLGLLLGKRIDEPHLLSTAFTPHLTAQGVARFKAWVGTCGAGAAPEIRDPSPLDALLGMHAQASSAKRM